MKKLFYYLFISSFLSFPLTAQHTEVGVSFGVSNYLGDLSPEKPRTSMGKYHKSGGIFIRSQRNEFLTIKLAGNYGKVSADDQVSSYVSRQNRNLNFQSKIWEASATLEYYILGYEPSYMTKRISPYVFFGLGYFSFNPQAYAPSGELVDLQPLRTEGQGLPESAQTTAYKTKAFSFPLGGGIKFALTEQINIGAEMGLRATSTDYLDDVSGFYVADDIISENYGELAAAMANRSETPAATGNIRGNHRNNDWFLMGGVTLSYNFIDAGGLFKRKRAMGCPTF